MNTSYTIASDGSTRTRNKGGHFQVKAEKNPKGWKVYKKLKNGHVSVARLYFISMYRNIIDIINDAKKK